MLDELIRIGLTVLVLGIIASVHQAVKRIRTRLAETKLAQWTTGYTDGYEVGHLEGERTGRRAGLQDGIAIGFQRGQGETEIRLRKTDLSEYQRGREDAMASIQDFDRASRGEAIVRAA